MKKRDVWLVAVMVLVAGIFLFAGAEQAMAFTTTTGVGEDLYNLIVSDFIQGPIGTAAGVVLVVVGAVGAAMGKLSAAAWPLVGGGVLVAAPTLATSLGMIF